MNTQVEYKFGNYTTLLKRSLRLYRASFTQVILYSFLFAFLIFMTKLFGILFRKPAPSDFKITDPDTLLLLAINFVALIIFMAILWRMNCIKKHRHDTVNEDFTVGFYRVIHAIIANLIQNILVFAVVLAIYSLQLLLMHFLPTGFNWDVGLLIFLIFFVQFFLIIYVSTLFLFLIPIITLEKINILHAVEKTIVLVWNHWWRVFSLQITPWIFYLFTLFILKSVFQIDIHLLFFNLKQESIFAALLHMSVFALFIPWIAALLLVQLRDLEHRHKSRLKQNA